MRCHFFNFYLLASLVLFFNIFNISAYAQTASDAINVSGTVTSGGGCTEDCGGGGGSTPGCIDPTALNYDANADEDDGSCIYATTIPNVTNFQAVYNSDSQNIDLTWHNPSFTDFTAVRIVRSTDSFITAPDQGTLIYDGTSEAVIDILVDPGITYYYTAFVRSNTDAYSSGAVAQATVPLTNPDEPCIGDDCEEPPEECVSDDCPPITESPIDPFADLPSAGRSDFEIEGFVFYQSGQPPQYLKAGETILLRADKETTIYLSYEQVPEVLKTIGVTISNPLNPKSSFSFLLKLTADGKGYSATIAPLGAGGKYPVAIYIINYNNQSLKRITGHLQVEGAVALIPVTIVEQVVAPLVVGAGLLVGSAQILVPLSAIGSWYDLYLIILRALGALSGYLGFRKKHKPWGTVYDAVTKQPIDPAYVTIEQEGKEMSSAITDIDGRYGFFLPPGTYTLKAGKTHYQFPSTTLAGRSADELYGNLYFGESFVTGPDEVIDRNVPLDPIGFDWNEFTKSQSTTLVANAKKELIRARIQKSIYAIGLLTAVGSATYAPSWLSFGLLAAYVLLAVLERLWGIKRHVRAITWRETKLPIPFAIIRLSIPDLNQEVKHVVADGLGRFYVLVRPGVYSLSIEEKRSDGSYKKVYQSPPTTLSRGTWDSDITVDHNILPPEPVVPTSVPNLTQ
ncbi:MAG: carboxypeptidase regulatory-like domain-containing protein [Candidatus Vogelbacteria bacterium]|nr:carboxypeptidase regulatory-like domain-containing protein [Candidatus Vogelbacteria bacterium]